MFNFSPQLITRLQKYFGKRFGVNITPAQAEDYLDSLADLFLLFTCPPDDASIAGYAGLSPTPLGVGQDGQRLWPPQRP
jgi:hypothetical protein